ncbi:MAG: hypothetical protein ACO3BD_06765 [Chitinophagaceae bacterium]
MKSLFLLLTLTWFIFFSVPANAHDALTVRVYDALTDAPIVGATVSIAGYSYTTIDRGVANITLSDTSIFSFDSLKYERRFNARSIISFLISCLSGLIIIIFAFSIPLVTDTIASVPIRGCPARSFLSKYLQ